MDPTIEAELAAVRRSLGEIAAGDEVSAEVGAQLSELARSLQVLERSWAKRLPYLVADNAALAALLGELADPDCTPLDTDIGAATYASDPVYDPAAADKANSALRAQLARVIVESAEGDEARRSSVSRRASAMLAKSLEMRPW